MSNCKNCDSKNIIKAGSPTGCSVQMQICGCRFVIEGARISEKNFATKAMCVILYLLTQKIVQHVG